MPIFFNLINPDSLLLLDHIVDWRDLHPIQMPKDVNKANLVVDGKLTFLITFAEKINPTDDYQGMQVRLSNLAMYDGNIEGNHDETSKLALKLFQEKQNLEQTGEFDSDGRTEQCLKKEYGC